MSRRTPLDLHALARALEASWDAETAYPGIAVTGMSALGQCYPTARVVQHLIPECEIADGEVWTGERIEHHFWNVIIIDGRLQHIDFTWQQFPAGSSVRSFTVRDRHTLGDRPATIRRVGRRAARKPAPLRY